MATPSGSAWIVECWIGDREVTNHVHGFQWKSLVNGGYIVRARIEDPYFNIHHRIIEGDKGLLKTGRQYATNPTLIRFKLKWNNGFESKERIALVADAHCFGTEEFSGRFEFIAVDPISYYINAGDASGKMYHGKIGGDDGVIHQVLEDYVPPTIQGREVKFVVDDTDDQPNNYWMMRQDPKTFIASLLEWSCSFTKHRTSWIVANGQEEDALTIEVKESWNPNLEYPNSIPGSEGPLVLVYGGPPTSDIDKWEMLTDNFISALSLKLVTSGMSATSGKYWDKIIDDPQEVVFVKDENTENKTNPSFTDTEGFTKPRETDRGWTHIISVPEMYSAGDIGFPYQRYLDGRARQRFMEVLNMLMRIRVTISGEPRLYDSTELGRTKVTLVWTRPDRQGSPIPRAMDGDWLMYGWHHKLSIHTGMWCTDVYLARLDWDAAALPGSR